MSFRLRRRDLRTHLYIATVTKFLATYVYIFLIFFLIFLLDFIIVTINLIQFLAAILIRINYLSIYLSIYPVELTLVNAYMKKLIRLSEPTALAHALIVSL